MIRIKILWNNFVRGNRHDNVKIILELWNAEIFRHAN